MVDPLQVKKLFLLIIFHRRMQSSLPCRVMPSYLLNLNKQ